MNEFLSGFSIVLLVVGLGLFFLVFILPDEADCIREQNRGSGNEVKTMDKFVINVPYTVLVQEIILFTGPLLAEKRIKNYPGFKIRYYKNKRFLGVFYDYRSEMEIYLKGHDNLQSLVDTVLHEVAHYMQQKTSAVEYKKYQDYTNQYGYYDNPLEIEARAFAKKHTKACIRHLESKDIIRVA